MHNHRALRLSDRSIGAKLAEAVVGRSGSVHNWPSQPKLPKAMIFWSLTGLDPHPVDSVCRFAAPVVE